MNASASLLNKVLSVPLVVLASRPSVGKSQLAFELSKELITRKLGTVTIFALEMTADGIRKRLAGVGLESAHPSIIVDDTIHHSAEEILATISETSPPRLIVVDYINLLGESMDDALLYLRSEVVKLGATVLALSQLKSAAETHGPRPEYLPDEAFQRWANLIITLGPNGQAHYRPGTNGFIQESTG